MGGPPNALRRPHAPNQQTHFQHPPLSDDERARYAELDRKSEVGPLSMAEGAELMQLAERLGFEERSNVQPSANAVTNDDRTKFAILTSKANLNGSEQLEVVRLGGLIQAADETR